MYRITSSVTASPSLLTVPHSTSIPGQYLQLTSPLLHYTASLPFTSYPQAQHFTPLVQSLSTYASLPFTSPLRSQAPLTPNRPSNPAAHNGFLSPTPLLIIVFPSRHTLCLPCNCSPHYSQLGLAPGRYFTSLGANNGNCFQCYLDAKDLKTGIFFQKRQEPNSQLMVATSLLLF